MIFRVAIFFLGMGCFLFGALQAQEATNAGGSDPSPFARLLAKAAMDSSLLNNRRTAVGSVSIKKSSGEAEPSFVTLMQSSGTDSGWQSVYLVRAGELVDTVRVFIEPGLSAASDGSGKIETMDTTTGITRGTSVCESELTEPAFLNLRGRMAAASSEREMITMVERAVRKDCFSLSQVRRLCNIFLYDLTRVEFFETVHGHVADPQHFSQLRSFLSDPVCLRRFDLLIGR